MERSPTPDIEALSTAELIRRRKDMFFDPAKPDIASELAMQALCHAADEAMDGRCRAIAVGVRGALVQVRYDCGMPLTPDRSDPDWTVAEMFLLTLRACSSRKKHLEIGSEFCSIGVAVLNAVCAEMNVDIVDAGRRAQLRFERGVQIGICAPEPSELADSTSIEFELDGSVLPDADLSEIALRRALDGLAVRFPETAVSFDFRA